MGIMWEVGYFSVGGTDLTLFGNGRMQVGVNVAIMAKDPATKQEYTLSQSELDRIQLVDYYNTTTPLGSGWSYTTTENGFGHTMPTSMASAPTAESEPAPLSNRQNKRYWVSTTKMETKRVGARIQQPNGAWITTNSKDFDNYVSLRASEPIYYNMGNVDYKRSDTASGSDWDQDNSHLTSRRYPFKTAELHSYKSPSDPMVGLRYCRGVWRESNDEKHIQYLWPMGSESTVRAGFTHDYNGAPLNGGRTVDIKINDVRNAFCVTRLRIKTKTWPYNQSWWFVDSWVRVIDIYGNHGDFNLSGGANIVELSARARLTSADSEFESERGDVVDNMEIAQGDDLDAGTVAEE